MRNSPTFPGLPADPGRAAGRSSTCLAGNNPELKRRLATDGACEAVIAAMRRHPADRNVQEQGCWAVTTLGTGSPDNRKRLGRRGAVKVVVVALRAFRNDKGMQEHGSRALRNLSIKLREEGAWDLASCGATAAGMVVLLGTEEPRKGLADGGEGMGVDYDVRHQRGCGACFTRLATRAKTAATRQVARAKVVVNRWFGGR
jgi:hypothetical protein